MKTYSPSTPGTRRRVRIKLAVALSAAAVALAGCAQTAGPSQSVSAPSGPIGAMAVKVHKDFITGATGAKTDVLQQCSPKVTEPTWQLVQYNDLQQLAFREASLGSTDNDLFFLLDSWASPRLFNLLQPLNSYEKSDPIKDFSGISPDILKAYQQNGKDYGIPIRTTTVVLMYDMQRLADAGFKAAPSTLEQLVSIAKKTAGTGSNGQPVYGIRFSSVDDLIPWVRAYGGELINSDYSLGLTNVPTIEALTTLKGLYDAKAIPADFATLSADDWLRMEEQGQVAMTVRGSSYYTNLNDPNVSRIAGHVGVSTFPATEAVGGDVAVPAATWYMSIPKNAKDKQAAWDFIVCVSSPKSTDLMALNNNTPVRASTFSDPAVIKASVPAVSEAQKKVLAVAKPGLPGFDNQAKAVAIIQEDMVDAITGVKTPAAAMKDAAAKVKPLLPAK